jgi:hypothetical protein
MYAAAAGHSTLGIPKSVGQEFVDTDKPGRLPEHIGRAIGGGIGADRIRLQFGGGEFGSISAMNPWWERAEARRIADVPFHAGLVTSSGAGRTDQIPMSVGSDSHVIPAAEMAGLGQGNGLFGGRALTEALRIGPYGVPLPQHMRGPGPPRPPPAYHMQGLGMAGGGRSEEPQHKSPILVAGGEYIIPPEDWIGEDEHGQLHLHAGVRSLGRGDMKKGHEAIDRMIMNIRRDTIDFLKHAPAPKK